MILIVLVLAIAAPAAVAQGVGPPWTDRERDSMLALPDSAWDIPDTPGLSRRQVIEFMRRMLRAPDSTFAGPDARHRTDAEMTRTFREHRRDFETLLRMFRQDSTVSSVLGPDTLMYRGPSPLPPARQREYDRLLGKLGVILMVREPRAVLFRTTTVHTFDRKGYIYTTEKVTPIVVHETTSDPGGHFRVYRRLEGSWYVYFQVSS